MSVTAGTRLGPYELSSLIGAGGMGEVYKARDTRLGRDVAVKVLSATVAADDERLRRFEQEARAVAALSHPNILAVYDIGQENGTHFLVSELLEGESLREALARGAFSHRKSLGYAVQIAHALAAAHSKNIAHRDLKPDNIFITRDGRVKILDFGLAKSIIAVHGEASAHDATVAAPGPATDAGTVMGTAGYMSPEQVRGLPVDCRTDIFSFGAVLYEMLTGARAFKRDTAAETMTAVLHEDPPESEEGGRRRLPPALARIVRHCLEKSPDQRFQSARDLAFDLESAGDLTPSEALPAAEPVGRRRWPYYIAAALIVAIGLGVGSYLLVHSHTKTRITDRDQIIVADFDNKTGDSVFDSTLKEALDIQLEQSPYLQLVNDQELHGDLRYLGQPADQKITPALAREIGQREGIKAYLAGSVASLGNSYVVSIDAVNCATGDTFAREQVEAPDKPHVLTAVASAVTALRATLGESLASIHKLSSPYMDVTTSSLEAFHDFSLGEDEHRKGHDLPEAESFYKQAIELDPTFAMAYARLGVTYLNSGSSTQGILYMKKAYELRERVTERERLYIEAQLATMAEDLPKGLELYQLDATTYPRDSVLWNNMGNIYSEMGDLPKAVAAYERSYDLAKWDVVGAANAAQLLLASDRLPEAKHYLEEARIEGGMEDTNSISILMLYRFLSGDGSWRQLIPTVADHQDAFILDLLASNIDFFLGHIKDAQTDGGRGAQSAAAAKLSDTEATILGTMAINEAQLDHCQAASVLGHRALALDRSVISLPNSALALALCGEAPLAMSEAAKLAKDNPDNSLMKTEYLPEVQAAAALSEHRPQEVKGLLANAEIFGVASYVPYLEGRAFLEMKQPGKAAASLEPGRRWRGAGLQAGDSESGPIQFTYYPAALLLTARAQAMAGDKQSASNSYKQLLDIWKTADADFKPAADAKSELAALQQNGKI
ncbi:MAG TPA: protein kinase [Silvibacterium sp.]|nr:protein kinase [Silvibacterium sp.]